MRSCALCGKKTDESTAAILTMGSYANPRYLCPDCEKLVSDAEGSDDPDVIKDASDKIAEYMMNCKDLQAIDTLGEILKSAAERRESILDGSYVSEEPQEEELADIPDECEELEEDRIKDERDAEKERKFDRVLNIIWIFIFAALIFGVVWNALRFFNVI